MVTHLGMSLWAARLGPPGHPGTVVRVLKVTTLFSLCFSISAAQV